MLRTAFYCVVDASHFPGLVAMLNSLRLLGHDEPIVVADCGLEEEQRRRLAPHVTLVPAPRARTPYLLKCVAPLRHPATIRVLIDADVLVTRRLDALIEMAHDGRVVGFADRVPHRFDGRWGKLLGLGEVRRQTYVNSGLLVFPEVIGTRILERVEQGQAHVDVELSVVGRGTGREPFYQLDQDVFNACFASLIRPEQIVVLEHRLSPFPPFPGVSVIDETVLRCSYADGVEPFALHHIQRKPWLAATRSSVYTRLLSRILLAPDVTLRLDQNEVPYRLRKGVLAWSDQRRADVVVSLRQTRNRLAIRTRLRRLSRG